MQNQWLLLGISILLLCLAVAAVLFVPAFSMLLFPFLTALYTFIKQNSKPAISITFLLISLLFVLILTNSFIYAVLLSVLPFVAGNVVSSRLQKGASQKQLLLAEGIFACVFILGMFYSMNNALNKDTISMLYDSALDMFYQSADQIAGEIDPLLMADLKTIFTEAVNYSKRMFPYMLFALSAYSGYIALLFISGLNKLFRTNIAFVPRFSEFKCNTASVFVMAITAIASLFIKDGVVGIALDNIFAIFNFMLTMCAISLIDYLMKKKNWFVLFRIIVVLLLISVQSGSILSMVLSIIAFLDARADFRRLEH